MKTKTKEREITISINHDKVDRELNKKTVHNWVIEKGISDLQSGVMPGARMIDFLTHIGVITVK